MIKVSDAGALTLFQDSGRVGAQHMGVPTSGPFDLLSHMRANECVGNSEDATTLECTLIGPTLRFNSSQVIAYVGEGCLASINGDPFGPGEPTIVQAGSELSMRKRGPGARSYLAVGGGFVPDSFLGSRSQHAKSQIGPLRIEAGSQLEVGQAAGSGTVRRGPMPLERRIRVMWSPDVPQQAVEKVTGATWLVTNRADRMGVRLAPSTPLTFGGEASPRPSPLGAIQLPPDGNPIVLGPDRPTTGGYLVIGYVCKRDIREIAQALPGQELTIESIERNDALKAWHDALQT